MHARPLDEWVARRMGKSSQTFSLTRKDIRSYQLEKLRETVDYARRYSPFYREHLAGYPETPLESLDQLAHLPFTMPEHLMENGPRFLCVSQDAIERVVTLPGSGTGAQPKRLYFTEEELESIIDFFHYGMHILVQPGQKVLILMPGESPGSVGDLLAKAVRRMQAKGIVHGPVLDPAMTVQEIVENEIDCLVGIPVQVLSLARYRDSGRIPSGRIKSVLLCTDYVPLAILRELENAWKCRVINHYGTSEMGYGAALECDPLMGYHLREGDLFFEIVDPVTGRLLKEGEAGEVVFTTLTRKGMPLIRYRTGDLARFLPEPCACGSVLARMEAVRGKLKGCICIGKGHSLNITELDEILFPIPGVISYQVEISSENGGDCMRINFFVQEGDEASVSACAEEALHQTPAIRQALKEGHFRIAPFGFDETGWHTTGVAKRMILDRRRKEANT